MSIGRHHRAGPDRELAGRQARPVVHAVDRLDRVAVEHAFLDHHPRAALVLLGRLKDEMHRAGEIARLGQISRGAEQHRGVAVVAAGMHPARMPRGVREAVLLRDRQRVHVGAQRDCSSARVRRAGQRPDHAGAGDAALDVDAERVEQPRDDVGGAMLLEGGFRVGVQIAPPGRHVGLEIGDAVDDRHRPPLDSQTMRRSRRPAMSPSL